MFSSKNTTKFTTLRLRRRDFIQEFVYAGFHPVTLCNECWCAYCASMSKGAVCLRSKGVMRGLCPCPGCKYKRAVIADAIARRDDLVSKVKVLQGKSSDQTTNLILRYVLRFLE